MLFIGDDSMNRTSFCNIRAAIFIDKQRASFECPFCFEHFIFGGECVYEDVPC